MNAAKWLAIAYSFALLLLLPATVFAQNGPAMKYQGAVKWYIADLKTSFPQSEFYSPQTALTEANYRTVLNGLKTNIGVNGIRLPVFPDVPNPNAYPQIYKEVLGYARSIGLIIYASPLSVGMKPYAGWTDQQYADWLAAYTNFYKPDFLSPFNEPGINADRIIKITSQLRMLLGGSRTLIIGPDKQHVQATIKDIEQHPDMIGMFDIVTSHNANKDDTATQANWARLASIAMKPVWSSENPRGWDASNQIPGIADAIGGGVQGLVIWMAKPNLVDDRGMPTAKARDIAARLLVTNP